MKGYVHANLLTPSQVCCKMDSNTENSNTPNNPDEGDKDTDRSQSNMQNHNSKDEDANSAKNTQARCAVPTLVSIYKITKSGGDSSGNKSINSVLKSEHNGKYFAEPAKIIDEQDQENERDGKSEFENHPGEKEETTSLTTQECGKPQNNTHSADYTGTGTNRSSVHCATENSRVASAISGINTVGQKQYNGEINCKGIKPGTIPRNLQVLETSKNEMKNVDRLPIRQPVDKGETVPSPPVLPIGSHQTYGHLHSSHPMPQGPPPNIPPFSAQHALLQQQPLQNPQLVQANANAKNHTSEKPSYSYTEEMLSTNNSSGVSETRNDSGYCGTCVSMVNSSVKLVQQFNHLNGQRETKLQEAKDIIRRLNSEIDKLNTEKGELLQDVVHLNNNMKEITNKNETDHNHLKERLEELQQHSGWSLFGFSLKRNKDMDQKQIFEELFKHLKQEINAKNNEIAELKHKFNKKTQQQTNILKEKDIKMKKLEQNYDALSRKAYQFSDQNTDLKEKLSEKDKALKNLQLKCKFHVPIVELTEAQDKINDLNSKIEGKDDTINYLQTESKSLHNALSQAKDDRTVLEKRLQIIAEQEKILSGERRLFTQKLEKMGQFMEAFKQPITIDQVQRDTEANFIKNSLEKIRQVEAKARHYEPKIRTFYGNAENKAYLDYKEKLSRLITDELDTIESQGNKVIQNHRKEVIVYIQKLKKELEKKARETG